MQSAVPLLDLSDDSISAISTASAKDVPTTTVNTSRRPVSLKRASATSNSLTPTGTSTAVPLPLTANCGATDQPLAALLADLDQVVLEDTLVVWGGNSTNPARKEADGRDHSSLVSPSDGWGRGSRRPPLQETDEHSIAAVKNKILRPPCNHAPLPGLDHERTPIYADAISAAALWQGRQNHSPVRSHPAPFFFSLAVWSFFRFFLFLYYCPSDVYP